MLKRSLLFAMIFLGPAYAADAPPPPPMPVPANPPPPAEEGVPSPEVRIYRDKRGVVEEFSVGGSVYMVRITPSQGFPYYLIDHDGDGTLETRDYSPQHPGMIPQWILFSW